MWYDQLIRTSIFVQRQPQQHQQQPQQEQQQQPTGRCCRSFSRFSPFRRQGTREAPPRKIANTLGRMPLAALVNLLCSKLTGHFPMLLKKVLTDLRREVGGEASESM